MYKVYKPSTYLVVTYFPNYLPIYIGPTYRMGYQDKTRYEFSWGSSTTESKRASGGWCAGGLLVHSGPPHIDDETGDHTHNKHTYYTTHTNMHITCYSSAHLLMTLWSMVWMLACQILNAKRYPTLFHGQPKFSWGSNDFVVTCYSHLA
jgi:hypothetical protein